MHSVTRHMLIQNATALDGFGSTVEMTGTETGRNGTGTGKTFYRLSIYGSRSFTVCSRKFFSGKDLKIWKNGNKRVKTVNLELLLMLTFISLI